jgi:membrane protein required for colicin V production
MHFNISNLNYFDYSILAIILVSVIFGFYNGFIKSFLGFFAWIISIVLSLLSTPIAMKLLENHIKTKILLNIVAVFGSFILFLVVISIVNSIILKILLPLRKGIIDISLGGLFGVARGCFISCVLFWVLVLIMHTFSEGKNPQWVEKSGSYKALKIATSKLVDAADYYTTNKLVADYIKNSKEYLVNDAIENYSDQINESMEKNLDNKNIDSGNLFEGNDE